VEILYDTEMGFASVGDSRRLMCDLGHGSVDLVVFSPPFPLAVPREYWNPPRNEYVSWLVSFLPFVGHVLAPHGSLVVEIGETWQEGVPLRSPHVRQFLNRAVDELGWHEAQALYLYNPSTMPPNRWVGNEGVRLKPAVSSVLWLVRDPHAVADNRRVRREYSARGKEVIKKPQKGRFFHPSGHDRGEAMDRDRGGAIEDSLQVFPNTASNTPYQRRCRTVDVPIHPARFAPGFVAFMIEFLTLPGMTVLDPLAGSNTTGMVAEMRGRRWIAFEQSHGHLAASAFRFVSLEQRAALLALHGCLMRSRTAGVRLPGVPAVDVLVDVRQQQITSFLGVA
jgi:site-specific DNA-methyltransferase (cytosine-N4-specific)